MLGNVMKEEDLPRLPLYLSASSLVGHWVTCRAVAEQGTSTTRSLSHRVWQWGGGWGARLSWCMAEAMTLPPSLASLAALVNKQLFLFIPTTAYVYYASHRVVNKQLHMYTMPVIEWPTNNCIEGWNKQKHGVCVLLVCVSWYVCPWYVCVSFEPISLQTFEPISLQTKA